MILRDSESSLVCSRGGQKSKPCSSSSLMPSSTPVLEQPVPVQHLPTVRLRSLSVAGSRRVLSSGSLNVCKGSTRTPARRYSACTATSSMALYFSRASRHSSSRPTTLLSRMSSLAAWCLERPRRPMPQLLPVLQQKRPKSFLLLKLVHLLESHHKICLVHCLSTLYHPVTIPISQALNGKEIVPSKDTSELCSKALEASN